mgnify:FL=1
MSLEEKRRALASILVLIFPRPEDIPELVERVREAVERTGLRAFLRAEGYAFMQTELIGIYGLPHLRLAVTGDRISLWVRDGHKLGLGPELPGLSAERLYEDIVEGARAAASVIERYRDEKGIGALIQVP